MSTITRINEPITTGYLHDALDAHHIELSIKWMKSKIALIGKPDCLVFTGMSGALMTPMLSRELDIPMIMIRKGDDRSHSYRKFEGWNASRDFTYVIIDDLIASGDTIKKINKTMAIYAEERDIKATLEYIVCYSKDESYYRESCNFADFGEPKQFVKVYQRQK